MRWLDASLVRAADAASLGGTRVGLARVGVTACVALTFLVATFRLFDDALPGQNHWATLQARATYAERNFPSDAFIGSARVIDAARLWMPSDATYRIVLGPNLGNSPLAYAAPTFITQFLFPRHRDDSPSTRWVICIGCDVVSLGKRFEPLAKGANGVVFGRVLA
jgi:hypothetical protein